MRDMAGTMSMQSDSSAGGRADVERINEGNGNVREISKMGETIVYYHT